MHAPPFQQTPLLSSKQSTDSGPAPTVESVQTPGPSTATANSPDTTNQPSGNPPNSAQSPTPNVSPPTAEPQPATTAYEYELSSQWHWKRDLMRQCSMHPQLCDSTPSPAPGLPTTATSAGNRPSQTPLSTKTGAAFTEGSQMYTISQMSSSTYAVGSTTPRQGDATTLANGQTITGGPSTVQIVISVVPMTGIAEMTTGMGSYIWTGLNPNSPVYEWRRRKKHDFPRRFGHRDDAPGRRECRDSNPGREQRRDYPHEQSSSGDNDLRWVHRDSNDAARRYQYRDGRTRWKQRRHPLCKRQPSSHHNLWRVLRRYRDASRRHQCPDDTSGWKQRRLSLSLQVVALPAGQSYTPQAMHEALKS